MASLAPTQPVAHDLPSPSHHRPCTYSGCAQSLKPGPGVAWSHWPRSQAAAPCGAAAPRTQQPTSASTPTLGAGAGAAAEPPAPFGQMVQPRMRRTVWRPSAGLLPSCVCSEDCHCLGTGTERQNHARELVQGLSLSEWDGIVTLSGDGLLFEVLNGLLDRPDWEEAVKMPVGILPCGSGNALAGAVNRHGGFEPALGLDLLLNCSLLLCRGGGHPLDLLSVTLASGSRCFSFLSVAWGFVSDVDIQSERFRALGSARFTLGTVLGLAALHTYRGRLSYLPATVEPASPAPAHSLPRAKSELTLTPEPAPPMAHSPLHRSVSDLPLPLPQPALVSPGSPEPLPVLSLNGGGPELAGDWGGAGDAPLSPDPLLPSPPSSPKAAPLSPITEGPPEMPASSELPPPTPGAPGTSTWGPPDHLLPPLGTPLPPDWVTLEGDFVLILAISPSHLGADMVAAPHARFDDGLVHLCWVRSGISRAALLRLFLAMERGSHFSLGCPQLGYAAARAFRLEPLTPRGMLTVDGELVEYGPLQAQMHPGLGTLLTGPPGCAGQEP
ncbi:sphingosine kinase 2 isoform X3 [Sciurus carolinensis]|uniref:sphingosine kinase 2 isoform X3 n=1 Tax=Sciurus carolinensis TaxID=30640 RepID=UPI001FB1C85B|nr:sphingosine kinase 2 isoform X3 [Sciurus carolinensis]XP_047384163.1 sphingosine kinase 2 isoform X3 [Sciurus carolinensis]XP_047384164.1 sphingosine kinase 2 isoform X3 [Sciurus carolinensis]